MGDDSVNVAFISNFLEHLKSAEEIRQTLKEVHRILKRNGKLLILQPNIKYAYKNYWDFFDHVTPLSDKSTVEALINNDFKILHVRPKFLPYSTKSRLPKSPLLIRIYLKTSILQSIFGKQMFIVAEKGFV